MKKGESGKLDAEIALKLVLKKKLGYSLKLAAFTYFGMIFCLFFGNLLFPRILDPECKVICFIPTSSEFTALDSWLFSPVYIPIKLLFVIGIALLPALSYGKGFILSVTILSPVTIVVWHYAMASIGLEKLGASIKSIDTLFFPLGLVDGILVFIPAFAIGIIFNLAMEAAKTDKIPIKLAIKLISVPAGLAVITSILQWFLIF